MGNVVTKLLMPLAEVFGPMPNEGAVGAYEEVCGGYPDAVLDKARRSIVEHFLPSKVRPWPAPAICAKACKEHMPGESLGGSDFQSGMRKLEGDAVAFAQRWATQTAQGQMAAGEGWSHEGKGLVRQLYRIWLKERGHAPAPADIVIDGATVAQYRQAYGRALAAAPAFGSSQSSAQAGSF